ncbi:MAG: gamma-glutamyl-gamma-aminobutyrate hydrolase family protein, partial [Ktedonobacterales bacterium]
MLCFTPGSITTTRGRRPRGPPRPSARDEMTAPRGSPPGARDCRALTCASATSIMLVERALGRGGPRDRRPRVVVIDTGVKQSILDCVASQGLEPLLVPPRISFNELWDLAPNGVVLGNGPGDPAHATRLIELTHSLIPTSIPLLGICLGHQIIALAAGARTSKLRFGHHGVNHPVRDLRTGCVTITTQNHTYQVEAASIPRHSGFRVSHINLLDGSVEGLYHASYPIFSVQFHPEAAPGPHDNLAIFATFADAAFAHAEQRCVRRSMA